MHRFGYAATILSMAGMLFPNMQLKAQTQNAPAPIAAAMVLKVVGFEKTVGAASDITIYVLGAADVAAELSKGIGKPVGKGMLKAVETGADVPAAKPTLLFVGDAGKAAAAMAYSRANKILTVTGLPDLVSQGVTLGFGIGEDSKPRVLLNLTASAEEGLDWNPAILKVAKTVE